MNLCFLPPQAAAEREKLSVLEGSRVPYGNWKWAGNRWDPSYKTQERLGNSNSKMKRRHVYHGMWGSQSDYEQAYTAIRTRNKVLTVQGELTSGDKSLLWIPSPKDQRQAGLGSRPRMLKSRYKKWWELWSKGNKAFVYLVSVSHIPGEIWDLRVHLQGTEQSLGLEPINMAPGFIGWFV